MVALHVLEAFELYYPGEVIGFPRAKAEKLLARGVVCLLADKDKPQARAPAEDAGTGPVQPAEEAPKPAAVSLAAIIKPKGK